VLIAPTVPRVETGGLDRQRPHGIRSGHVEDAGELVKDSSHGHQPHHLHSESNLAASRVNHPFAGGKGAEFASYGLLLVSPHVLAPSVNAVVTRTF